MKSGEASHLATSNLATCHLATTNLATSEIKQNLLLANKAAFR
jgi:hypothetical protein